MHLQHHCYCSTEVHIECCPDCFATWHPDQPGLEPHPRATCVHLWSLRHLCYSWRMSNHPEPHDLLPLRFVTCRIAIAPPSLSLKSVSGYQCSPRCASATFSSSSFFAFIAWEDPLSFHYFLKTWKLLREISPAFTIVHYNVADLESCLSDFGLHYLSTSGWRDQSFRFRCLKWPLLLGPLDQL